MPEGHNWPWFKKLKWKQRRTYNLWKMSRIRLRDMETQVLSIKRLFEKTIIGKISDGYVYIYIYATKTSTKLSTSLPYLLAE